MDLQRIYWMIDSVNMLYRISGELHEIELNDPKSTDGKSKSWQEVVRLLFATLQVLKDIRDEEEDN